MQPNFLLLLAFRFGKVIQVNGIVFEFSSFLFFGWLAELSWDTSIAFTVDYMKWTCDKIRWQHLFYYYFFARKQHVYTYHITCKIAQLNVKTHWNVYIFLRILNGKYSSTEPMQIPSTPITETMLTTATAMASTARAVFHRDESERVRNGATKKMERKLFTFEQSAARVFTYKCTRKHVNRYWAKTKWRASAKSAKCRTGSQRKLYVVNSVRGRINFSWILCSSTNQMLVTFGHK